MRHRVVLFDIDNTLLNAGGAGRRALERAVLEITGVRAELGRVAFAGRTDPSILRDLLAVIGIEAVPDRLAAIFGRYVLHLEREVAEALATGAERKPRILPGVVAALDALSGREGVHLGLLTGNIAPGARIKMRPFELEARFPFGAFGDDAGDRPGLLPVALERWRKHAPCAGADCSMRDVYVVGDTVHDVGVAKRWGARSVAVGTGAPFQERAALLATEPDFFFEDLTTARPFLDEVLRGA